MSQPHDSAVAATGLAHDHLDWPFFEPRHRALARELDAWAAAHVRDRHGDDVDADCRALVRALGGAGWLTHAVGGRAFGGAADAIDTRAICILRETLARHNGLADFAFAMQGLGSGAISLAGTEAQKQAWLPRVARGEAISAFALSEPDAGSDVAAMTTSVTRGGRLTGTKTWISNGGIADFYTVFAREDAGISAFIVEASEVEIAERIDVIAPHPLATLVFDDTPAEPLGPPGAGMKIALSTLDVFRSTVGAAALGFARRALDEALARVRERRLFGGAMAELPLVQAKLADMALAIDASALLVYRSAWVKDTTGARVTKEAAMAKLYATESAQQVIDASVQLHGALGVTAGHPVEELYREIRALRIYEGASEVQQLIIARELLK